MKKILSVFIVLIFLIPIILFSANQANGENKEHDYIKVNLWSNELHVIKNNKIYATYPISSVADKSPTPIGTFKIQKKENHGEVDLVQDG